jgi:hypothetical protein
MVFARFVFVTLDARNKPAKHRGGLNRFFSQSLLCLIRFLSVESGVTQIERFLRHFSKLLADDGDCVKRIIRPVRPLGKGFSSSAAISR